MLPELLVCPCVLSVMMPIYNEEDSLAIILDHVLARPEVGEVIAIDDGSQDSSWQILTAIAAVDPRVRPLRQAVNSGKGSASGQRRRRGRV